MKKLTEKQRKILDFIEGFIRRSGMSPTVSEISENFGIKTSTVFAHLRALQRKNQLTRSSKARSIALSRHFPGTRSVRGSVAVPVFRDLTGSVAESARCREGELIINRTMYDGVHDVGFALRVRDDAMRELGIWAGDLILVAPEAEPRPGDIVAAVTPEGAVFRSYYPGEGGRFELREAGGTATGRIYRSGEAGIAGVAALLIRRF